MSSRFEKTAFVVVCRDGVRGAAVRAAHSAEHMAYIETVMDELNVAGPLYEDADGEPIGSLYCLHTKSAARARQIIENDPYYIHGAFETVEYFPHLPAAGKYIGGKIW
jgi:uncharacterized protein YciI